MEANKAENLAYYYIVNVLIIITIIIINIFILSLLLPDDAFKFQSKKIKRGF